MIFSYEKSAVLRGTLHYDSIHFTGINGLNTLELNGCISFNLVKFDLLDKYNINDELEFLCKVEVSDRHMLDRYVQVTINKVRKPKNTVYTDVDLWMSRREIND